MQVYSKAFRGLWKLKQNI